MRFRFCERPYRRGSSTSVRSTSVRQHLIKDNGAFCDISISDAADIDATFNACMSGMEALYENSEPFFKYLQSQGLDHVLRKTSLRLREKHAVVPHVRNG
jgi:hypothetical protein